MAGQPDDPSTWASHLLWPDGMPEPTSSLLRMLDEAERDPAAGARPADADTCAFPESERPRRQRDDQHDDFADLEPPLTRACAGSRSDGTAAKGAKAEREKQRRAQLNSRCAPKYCMCLHRGPGSRVYLTLKGDTAVRLCERSRLRDPRRLRVSPQPGRQATKVSSGCVNSYDAAMPRSGCVPWVLNSCERPASCCLVVANADFV